MTKEMPPAPAGQYELFAFPAAAYVLLAWVGSDLWGEAEKAGGHVASFEEHRPGNFPEWVPPDFWERVAPARFEALRRQRVMTLAKKRFPCP